MPAWRRQWPVMPTFTYGGMNYGTIELSQVTGPYQFVEANGVRIAWQPELEGGGRTFGRDFVPVVGHPFGRVGRLCEMCCGAGYIGFSLLAAEKCDELVLSDINPAAIEAVRETIRINGLEDRVTVYQSDALASIPDGEEWDLVVSNPPHFPMEVTGGPNLLFDDVGWRMHRDFFNDVGDHLAPAGSILFQENSLGGEPEVFLPLHRGRRSLSCSNDLVHGRRRRAVFLLPVGHEGAPGLGVRGAADCGRSSSPRRTRR